MKRVVQVILFLSTTNTFGQNGFFFVTKVDEYRIRISHLDNNLKNEIGSFKIDFSNYGGLLQQGNIQSKFQAIQSNTSLDKFYFYLFDTDFGNDEMLWSRFFVYDLLTNQLSMALDLEKLEIGSWKYVEDWGALVIEDWQNKKILLADLSTSNIRPIYEYSQAFGNIDIQSKNQNLLIYGHLKKNIVKISLSKETLMTQVDTIGQTFTNSFINNTSYRNQNVICLGQSGQGTASQKKKIRLAKNGESVERAFDYWLQTSFWVTDSEFIVVDNNSIVKLDLELNIKQKLDIQHAIIKHQLNNGFTVKVGSNSINNPNGYYWVSNDLQNYKELTKELMQPVIAIFDVP